MATKNQRKRKHERRTFHQGQRVSPYATNIEELTRKTRDELRLIAKQLGLAGQGYGRKNKPELVELIARELVR
jgi:hypothetical protein